MQKNEPWQLPWTKQTWTAQNSSSYRYLWQNSLPPYNIVRLTLNAANKSKLETANLDEEALKSNRPGRFSIACWFPFSPKVFDPKKLFNSRFRLKLIKTDSFLFFFPSSGFFAKRWRQEQVIVSTQKWTLWGRPKFYQLFSTFGRNNWRCDLGSKDKRAKGLSDRSHENP